MTNSYQVGDRVRLHTDTPFQNAAGEAFDPDVVTFEVRDPAGETEDYVYGTDDEVTRLAEGDYACDVDVDTAGRWYYYVAGKTSSGENRGAHQGTFAVVDKNT